MLLTNTINAVVTNTQNILSNVIGTQCVVFGLLAQYAAEPMEALRSKRHRWHAMSRSFLGLDQNDSKQRSDSMSGHQRGMSFGGFSGCSFQFCSCFSQG